MINNNIANALVNLLPRAIALASVFVIVFCRSVGKTIYFENNFILQIHLYTHE